jgi:hypothetical protein
MDANLRGNERGFYHGPCFLCVLCAFAVINVIDNPAGPASGVSRE